MATHYYFFNTFLPLGNSWECLELVIYHSLYLEYFPHTSSWARALTRLVSLRTRVISSGRLDSALLSILALFVLLPCEPTSYFLYGNCLTNCLIFFPIQPLSWELWEGWGMRTGWWCLSWFFMSLTSSRPWSGEWTNRLTGHFVRCWREMVKETPLFTNKIQYASYHRYTLQRLTLFGDTGNVIIKCAPMQVCTEDWEVPASICSWHQGTFWEALDA